MNKIVEDYIILDKIGQGQYGDVFRAQHKITKQYFAIKAMNL